MAQIKNISELFVVFLKRRIAKNKVIYKTGNNKLTTVWGATVHIVIFRINLFHSYSDNGAPYYRSVVNLTSFDEVLMHMHTLMNTYRSIILSSWATVYRVVSGL
jgi:uncharacterized MAPEG superfamily protein